MPLPLKTSPFESADAFLNALIQFAHSTGIDGLSAFYRGVRDADYDLMPSAFRQQGEVKLLRTAKATMGLQANSLNTETTHRLAELAAIARFYFHANKQGVRLPSISQPLHEALSVPTHFVAAGHLWRLVKGNWPPAELRPIMALAQHYGIPTRLLDWSSDVLAAAYFAASGAFEDLQNNSSAFKQRLAVWVTLPNILDRTAIHAKDDAGRQMQPAGDPLPDYVLRVVNTPSADNPNLAAQAGHFTLVEHSFEQPTETDRTAFDDAIRAVVKHYRDHSWDLKQLLGQGLEGKEWAAALQFSLPIREAPDLLRRLRRLNYGVERLYPGLKGCAQAVDEETSLLEFLRT